MLTSPKLTNVDDLSTLRYHLHVRSEEQLAVKLSNEQTKNQYTPILADKQSSLVNAHLLLREKSSQLVESDTKIETFAALRTRQIANAEAVISSVESEARTAKREEDIHREALQVAVGHVVHGRRELADTQMKVDELLRWKQIHEPKVRLLDEALEQVHAEGASKAKALLGCRQELELEMKRHETRLESSVDHSRRLTESLELQLLQHEERVASLKKQCDDIRCEQDCTHAVCVALRKNAERSIVQEEELMIRWRRADDEAIWDDAQTRRKMLQRTQSDREDKIRKIKSQAQLVVDELRGKICSVQKDVEGSLNEAIRQGFQKELSTIEEVGLLQGKLSQASNLQSVHEVLRSDCATVQNECSEQREVNKVHKDVVELWTQRYCSLKDSTAPLDDLNQQLVSLHAVVEERKIALGDLHAQKTILNARADETLRKLSLEIEKVHETKRKTEDSINLMEAEHQDLKSSMENELRVLRSEKESLDANISDLQRRNQLLDTQLKLSESERAARLQDAVARTNQAKQMAEQLLMQLQ